METKDAVRPDPALLASLVEASGDAIGIFDTDLDAPDGPVIEYLNDAALKLGGWNAPEDIVGQRYRLLVGSKLLATGRDAMRQALSLGQPVEIEAKATLPLARSAMLRITFVPCPPQNGSAARIFCTVRDVTSEKRSEQERKLMLRLFTGALGVIDQPLAAVDDAGHFAFVDNAFTRDFGWKSPELAETTLLALLDPLDTAVVAEQLRTQAATRSPWRRRTRLRHHDGRLLPTLLAATSIAEPEHRLHHVVTFDKDGAVPGAPNPHFEAAVQQALVNQGDAGFVVAGRLQLVELKEARDVIGERWPAVAERCMGIAERVLRAHLMPGDVYTQHGSDGFLVCFASLSSDEARFKARAITLEIRTRLVGEIAEQERPELRTVVDRVPVSEITADPTRSLGDLLDARLAREQARVEQTAKETLRLTLGAKTAVFDSVHSAAYHAGDRTPMFLARPPVEARHALISLETLGIDRQEVETEMVLLSACAERVLHLSGKEHPELLVTSVRADTLLNQRDANRWLQVARSVAGPARKCIVAEIVGVHPEIARSRLAELVIILTSLFRMVALELPSVGLDFIHGMPIGIGLATLPVAKLGPETDSNFNMVANRLVKLLSQRHCGLLIKDVASTAQAAALAKAGVTLTSSAGGVL